MTKSTQLGLVDVEFSAEFNGSALRSKKIGIKSTHPPKNAKNGPKWARARSK